MITRMSSAMTQLTLALSALGGYPVSFSAAVYFAGSQPSILVEPIVVTTSLPDSAGTDLKDSPAFPRKSFARSHAVCRDHGPMKIWKLQSLAATVMGVLFWYASRSGLR